MPPDSNDPGREAWLLSFAYFRRHRAHMQALQEAFDLTPMQMHALRGLEPGQVLAVGLLAERIHCEPSNVTKVVAGLAERRLIERAADPSDGRVRAVRLTRAGVRRREELNASFDAPPPMIASLPPAEQEALRRVLRLMADQPQT